MHVLPSKAHMQLLEPKSVTADGVADTELQSMGYVLDVLAALEVFCA